MSLRLFSRPGIPYFYIRGTVRRQSLYESTGTGDRQAAEAYRAKREAELWSRAVYGARPTITFPQAALSYLEATPRGASQTAAVGKLADHFKHARLAEIDQDALDRAYRVLLRPDAAPGTRLRAVLTPLRAVLEHAARRKWCDRPAFEVPRQPAPRVAFLTPAQATDLVRGAIPSFRPLLVFLIGTGARLSEALELDWRQVDLVGARVLLLKTKTGRERRVDLPPAVIAALSTIPHRDGRVFRPVHSVRRDGTCLRQGLAYRDSGRAGGGQIRTAWAGACRRAGLPGEWRVWTSRGGIERRVWAPELRPHDTRHTAATWQYALHHDLLRLQAWGGWANVSQVQIYAHVLPEAYVSEVGAWLNCFDQGGANSVQSAKATA